jgi:hypothetical protein
LPGLSATALPRCLSAAVVLPGRDHLQVSMTSGPPPDPGYTDGFEVTKVYYKNSGAGKRQVTGRQRSIVQSRVRKVQNGRQAQGQARQNSQTRES